MASELRLRVLVAKPGLDGHDRGAKVVARALRDGGFEVIYTGLHQSVEAIVAAAIAEDVDAVGLSILSGSHIPFTRDVRQLLDASGASDIPIVVGGIVPHDDLPALREAGAAAIFPVGSNILELANEVRQVIRGRNGVLHG